MTEYTRDDLMDLITDNMLNEKDIDQLMQNQKDASQYVHFKDLAVFQITHLKNKIAMAKTFVQAHGTITEQELKNLWYEDGDES